MRIPAHPPFHTLRVTLQYNHLEGRVGLGAGKVSRVPHDRTCKMYSILVVDDEPSIRGAIAQWFTLRGYFVETAADGQVAVDMCKERRYDVVTMDLEMPRLSGRDAIPVIRGIAPETPILIVTGFPQTGEDLMEAGVVKVITKPLRLQDLEREVRGMLEACA